MINKKELIEFLNIRDKKLEKYKKKNSFYHSQIQKFYDFFVEKNSKILYFSCDNGDNLNKLNPSKGIGLDYSNTAIKKAREKYKYNTNLEFIACDIEEFDKIEMLQNIGEFDYIIINGSLGYIDDIEKFLKKLFRYCSKDTRIIVYQYNFLFKPILALAEKLNLKIKEKIENWISVEDIKNFFYLADFENISEYYTLLLPINIPVISFLINKFFQNITGLRRICLNQFMIFRPLIKEEKNNSVSVVLTCRDEKGNIEELVKRIPDLGIHTEIVFVEGHSVDGTREEIQRVIKAYPNKDIKLLIQDGIGQGDAFRKGFDAAKGDFVIWLEADLTTPPEEIEKFYYAYITGKGEYINGSRFIYHLSEEAMPFLNNLGNRFFGNLFTAFLGQRFTDTLCGVKAISKKNYLRIRKEIDYFGDFDPFGDFELIFGATKKSLKVCEIPVKYEERKYGSSKAYGGTKIGFFKHGLTLLKMSAKAFKLFRIYL